MVLTSLAVDEMMKKCVLQDCDLKEKEISVEGIINTYNFNIDCIDKNAETISALLAELPEKFHYVKGNEDSCMDSFLDTCRDKNGNQWTGLHQQMESLICLGIAAKKASWVFPRDMWMFLPGGVPFVSINLQNKPTSLCLECVDQTI